jgi:hypothetical protein
MVSIFLRVLLMYSYTNLQVQGGSVKGDITCCNIEPDYRGRNRGRKAKLSLKTRQMHPVWAVRLTSLTAIICDADRSLDFHGGWSWQKSCNSGFSDPGSLGQQPHDTFLKNKSA